MEPAFKTGELEAVESSCGSKIRQSGCLQPVLDAPLPAMIASSFVSKQGRTEWVSIARSLRLCFNLFSHSTFLTSSVPLGMPIAVRLGLHLGCMDSVDWNSGMEWWNGGMEWNGLEWNGMEWNGQRKGPGCECV